MKLSILMSGDYSQGFILDNLDGRKSFVLQPDSSTLFKSGLGFSKLAILIPIILNCLAIIYFFSNLSYEFFRVSLSYFQSLAEFVTL